MTPMVRPRKTSAIALPAGGTPLPEPGRRVPLSPFDAYWVTLPPVRRVFLYRSPASHHPFSDVAAELRSSLEQVLPSFHPFAGVLTYSSDPLGLSIVLPEEGEGACSVAFVEAETDHQFDKLVEEYDEEALRQLAPDIRRDELPAPVMAAQVTEFVGGAGGVAVGVAVHHSAADGNGLWRFLEMWSLAAAGVKEGQVWAGPEPLHDRTLVRFDGDDDLSSLYLQQLAPDFPRIAPKQDAPSEQGRPLSRRTFTFAASAVRRLKQCLAAAANTGTVPSTFATIAAHGWVSIARARGFTDDTPVFAAFLADCRAHMSPPVPAAYIGNCVAFCTTSLSGSLLAGPTGPAMALLAIQEAVAEVKRDPLADRDRWCTKFAAIPPGRAVILVGSPWFPAYGVDFGFGRPARVELASMNHDGEMALVAGREPGSVQVSVAIAAEKMPAFRGMFELECDRASAMPVSESE
ncbi:anthocyanidin 3-O-glucoside 6''-O-acyltransferase-like [Lolium perenne]|uniref:anthocyanidin 3-O-glucoside 6''-O-acyltransferase-like n=1 Tax=Lolium perenne TaxID=4522 RepID=UPI003A998BFE